MRLTMNPSGTLSGGVGGNGGLTNWTILDNGLNNTVSTSTPLDGNTHLALLKIDYTAGTSSLWMDPTIATFDGTPTPSMTTSFAPVFNRIELYNRYNGVSTDEITLASTFKAAFHLEQNLTPDMAMITALPVEWNFFTATCSGDHTLLEWSTASEFNNSQFIVARSSDGTHWSQIGKVQGAGNTGTD